MRVRHCEYSNPGESFDQSLHAVRHQRAQLQRPRKLHFISSTHHTATFHTAIIFPYFSIPCSDLHCFSPLTEFLGFSISFLSPFCCFSPAALFRAIVLLCSALLSQQISKCGQDAMIHSSGFHLNCVAKVGKFRCHKSHLRKRMCRGSNSY